MKVTSIQLIVSSISGWVDGESNMSCLKGKKEDKPAPGNYKCTKCGAVSSRKKHICKPKKIKG
jgi:hypothetical protein